MNGASRITVVGSGELGQRVHSALCDAGLPVNAKIDAAIETGLVIAVGLSKVPAVRAVAPGAVLLAVVPGDDVAAALAQGATDAVASEADAAELIARARALLSLVESDRIGRELAQIHEALVMAQGLLASSGASVEVMREILQAACGILGFDRSSLIANIEASERAFVVAASDDPTVHDRLLGAWDYPEVREAVKRSEHVIIDDALEHPLTAAVVPKLRESGVRAIVVVPVVWQGRALGVLVFRKNTPGASVPAPRLSFAHLCAAQLAAHLHDSQVVRTLRDQTHRIARSSYETERRARTVESLKEHFEASADGVFAVADDGDVVFVNGVAEAITGFARDALVGASLFDLILDGEMPILKRAIDSVLGGQNIEAFDLHLSTTSGRPVCVSVTTSTVLSKGGAVILSFREVTQERALEDELRKTKEFLEKMIDSTVDGIVAADTDGVIILFNPGAERIFGYRAADVLGRLTIDRLYPPGVSRQVIRMLRADAHGGVGRLEQTRREIVSQSGELVPVNMTASIIYEGDREVATVGIFSDLRERIHIEQRLLKAQEKLELTEKRALVAQLAGTAAHELNQPLTSIMGYAQLVSRQLDGNPAGARAIDIILREAERMADIVRKIGRITQFETKEYVGSASIIDLDKSAPSASPSAFGMPVRAAADAGAAPAAADAPDPAGAEEDVAPDSVDPFDETTAVVGNSRKTLRLAPVLDEVQPRERASSTKETMRIPRLDDDGSSGGAA